MVRTTSSPVWSFFDKLVDDPSHVECKQCKVKVSRGSSNPKKMTNSNMKNHLSQKHPDQYTTFKKTDEENNQKKRQAEEDEEDPAGAFSLRNKKQKNDLLQLTVPDLMADNTEGWKMNDPRNMRIHKSVLTHMIWDLQPFNIVNQPGFLTLLKTLNPKFSPGSDKYYRDMMQKSYDGCKEKMMNILAHSNPDDITLVLDGWSQFHHSYIGVNIHFIDEDWKRRKFNLGCVQHDSSHTSEAMARLTEDLAQEWHIADKITFVVSDSAANMVRMGELLGWGWGDCACHSFQLVINDELLGLAAVETVVEKCRKVCTFNNKSPLFSNALAAAQEPLAEGGVVKQLVQDVRTRWNSTYDMMSRFQELKQPIVEVLSDDHWADKLEVSFFNSDWELISKCVTVLKVFKEATVMLSSSDASISQVIPIVKLIRDSLEVDRRADRGVITLKKKLVDALDRRFASKEEKEKYSIATLLDPRYKKVFFQDPIKCEEAVQKLLEKLKEETRNDVAVLVPGGQHDPEVLNDDGNGEQEFSIKRLMEKAVNANKATQAAQAGNSEEDILESYLSSPVQEKGCLKFWKKYEAESNGNPVKKALARLAKQFLTPPPTSTDIERLFSVAGNILTDERNRLLPVNVAKLLFMRENIMNYNYIL
jgi:hypothetical protein